MRLKDEALSKRLEGYTDNTIYLISEGMNRPREVYRQCRDIVTNSELNEEEVVKQLKMLLAEE